MLRRVYLSKYKEQNPYSPDLERGTDNYFLESNRPLKEKDIKLLPKEKLDRFVDEVLTNKKINNILYNSNAKAEIKILKKTNESLKKYKKKKKNEKPEDPAERNIGKIREKNEIIHQAQTEVQNVKKNTYEDFFEKTRKNIEFYNSIQTERNDTNDSANIYKTQRIFDIFGNLQRKLTFDSIHLPQVKLDVSNVYSRLYHNVVFLPKPKQLNNNYTESNTHIRENLTPNLQIRTPKNILKVKNVLESSSGKEFTLKITDELLAQCFTKHSGGPSLKFVPEKLQNSKKSNLNNRDENGNSLLHLAIMNSQTLIINYLLEKGVDINSQNSVGDTPLHIAIRKNDKTFIQILLNHHADINILNNDKKSPFDISTIEQRKLFRLEKAETKRSYQS